tara:strand:- start:310 stop:738 length:429 start_codon:yes stop_codon:yes gene_type:complete
MTNATPASITITVTRAQLDMLEAYLRESKGYDTTAIRAVTIEADCETLVIIYTAQDDFQAHLDYDKRVNSGYSETVEGKSFLELQEALTSIPNREMRELQVMAKKLAGMTDSSKLTSAMAKSFAASITEAHSNLLTMIEDKS